jgi:uncharacterized protein involved in propanediol utilization
VRDPRRALRASVIGHLGELLQGRLGPGGPVALVTLPAPPLRVVARLAQAGPLAVYSGGDRLLSPGRAAALHRALLGTPPRGRLGPRSAMPAGGGGGSSTAALLAAAAVFVAAHRRSPPAPAQLARVCVALEGASDPLMHARPERLLWAPREGRILTKLPPLPPVEVVGGFMGPATRTDASDDDFADVADLVVDWGPAAARGDLAALGALATESARRNLCRRGGVELAPLVALAREVGAHGVVAAHTGSARGLLFEPGRGSPDRAAEALAALGARRRCHFRLPATGAL